MDIDIDVADRDQLLEKIVHRKATLKNGKVHNTGIYVTEIPHDPITNQATINYETAESRGYFKIDILNVGIYKDVIDNHHLDRLSNTEPVWELLEHKEFVDQLFHFSGHHRLLKRTKPRSLKQLAAVLSMIRPGKRHLIGKPWDEIYQTVWEPTHNEEYAYKKSHSYAYAMAVIVHMNILCEQYEKKQS